MSEHRLTSLTDPDFEALFRNFEHSTFRLETLQQYNVDYERQPFQDFLAGHQRYTHPSQAEWAEGIRRNLEEGKSMSRVHVVLEPPSDYIRFEIAWPYQDSLAAGEHVRILPVTNGNWPATVPQFDYWLFDSVIAWRMDYAADGSFTHAQLVDDPAEVHRLDQGRVAALEASMPLDEYLRGT